MKPLPTLILILGTAYFSACNTPSNDPKNDIDAASKTVDSDNIVAKPAPVVRTLPEYEAWATKGNDSLKKMIKELSAEEQKVLHVLNRTDKAHLLRIDTIIIPKTINTDLLHYSPFPLMLNEAISIDKLVFFSYPIQAYAVYENGKLLTWGPTNMGKKATPTPTGLFFSNWRGKEIKSSVNSSWILKWNFNISNLGGVGWHEYELPGYPASHSCLRLLSEDAKFLYDWADSWILKSGQLEAQGTPTIVFGAYPWGERRPWRSVLENPTNIDLSEENLSEILEPYLAKILKEQDQRIEVLASRASKDSTTRTLPK